LKTLVKAACLLALGAGACGELPAESNVADLRVLGVKCEPAGFLVNLDDPGAATEAELTAAITALVVDPRAPGGVVEVSAAVGCPDYIDTITSATQQGSKLCPPADATSMFPPPIGPLLATTTIVPADAPLTFPPAMTSDPTVPSDFQYHPSVSYGLRPDQVGAFFSPATTGIPALDESIAFNRAFGLPAIVNLTFTINGERAEAIKRVVYWPRLDPAQQPNTNPTLGDPADPNVVKIRFYSHRDDTTGEPDQEIADAVPTLSIAAGSKLYVKPNYDHAVDMNYLLNVRNPDMDAIMTKTVDRELLRFQFYATAGAFTPEMQFSELNPILSGGTLHTDAEWVLPTAEKAREDNLPPEGGIVTIWIVTHDERAGTDWASRTVRLTY
jgi:hypothetical protein